MQVTLRAGQLQGRPDRRAGARPPASAPAPGRCGRCRAAMSRPNRTGPATRRRSTRAICRDEADRRAIIGGLRFARRLFAAPALKNYVGTETLPGRDVQTDDELLDYARRNGGTCYHASCTCMMGSHPMSVVDSQLRVHGIDGLRVIDASVMPAVTSTNTNAPTIMIAERGADDPPRRPRGGAGDRRPSGLADRSAGDVPDTHPFAQCGGVASEARPVRAYPAATRPVPSITASQSSTSRSSGWIMTCCTPASA